MVPSIEISGVTQKFCQRKKLSSFEFMPVPIAPALITGLFGLGASAINHFSQRALSNNAFRQNVAMWNKQNLYNSPSAQVGRLIAAGLNPALAYGGSSQVVGNSDTPPQLDYSGVAHQPLVSPDAVMQAQQALSMEQSRKVSQQDIELKAAQTIESLNRGELSGAEADFAKEFALEKLTSMRLMNDQSYLKCEELSQTINNLFATRDLTRQQTRSLELANEFNSKVMEYKIEASQLSNLETRKRFRVMDAQLAKYSAEVNLIYENIQTAMIQNSYLPDQLSLNLSQGIKNIEVMDQSIRKIDEEIVNLASKTGLNKYELENYMYLHAPALTRSVGAAIGSFVDDRRNKK